MHWFYTLLIKLLSDPTHVQTEQPQTEQQQSDMLNEFPSEDAVP